MRVIAGTARGMKLKSPRGWNVRPTADRVREALFNIVGPRLQDKVVLDLFAGSGAVGIEALSRGAAHCVFVEKSNRHLYIIKENLNKTGFRNKARLMGMGVKEALKLLGGRSFQAGFIFMDPPYLSPLLEPALDTISSRKVLEEGGLIVIEHDKEHHTWNSNHPGLKQKKYGSTILSFIEHDKLTEVVSRGHKPKN